MASPEQTVRDAEQLLAGMTAAKKEQCADRAEDVRDAIGALRKAAEFTLGEKLALAAIGLGGVLGAVASGGTALPIIISLGAAGLSSLGVLANHTQRVADAKRQLESKMARLQACLAK